MIRKRTPRGRSTAPIAIVALMAWLGWSAPAFAQEDQSNMRDCPRCPALIALPNAGEGASAVWMTRAPITVGEFEAFATETSYVTTGYCQSPFAEDNRESKHVDERWWGGPGFLQTPDHPVVCVAPADARAYARWLSLKSGMSYRLPTRQELESRTSAQETRPTRGANATCNGNLLDKSARPTIPRNVRRTVVPCSDGFARTSPVSAFSPNAFGFLDAAANVLELAADTARADSRIRIAVGRSWATPSESVTSIELPSPHGQASNIGFRLVRSSQ